MSDRSTENGATKEPGRDERRIFSGEILVCEENPINRQVIREQLLRAGLAPIIVSNGQDGVALAQSHMEMGKPFDLILMDINMPVMDGFDATRKLRELGSKTPIVAFTSNAMLRNEYFLRFGMGDSLEKPYTNRELTACLSKYLTTVHPPGLETDGSGSGKTPVIDRETGVERCGGEVIYHRLLALFAKDHQAALQELGKAIDAGDLELAGRTAHTLKNAAGMIGATLLQSAAQEVESALRTGKSAPSPGQMSALEARLGEVLAALAPTPAQSPANRMRDV